MASEEAACCDILEGARPGLDEALNSRFVAAADNG
jgi:hypothetical protein